MQSDTALKIAAVDLGSNSFHMVLGRFIGGHLDVLDRLRDPVRLGAGIDCDGALTEAACTRALKSLEKFGQRLRDLPQDQVRVVGTNTLRRATNASELQAQAELVLGHPIEVISGQEEARLIYIGVHNTLSAHGKRIVVDIGGGSTEVIIGEEHEVLRAHSLYMGCVTSSQAFFPDGISRVDSFQRAETAAALELRSVEEPLRATGWESAVGASGTINAIREIVRLSALGDEGITLEALKKLRKMMISTGSVERLDLPGLKPERARVLPGGLAILIALFERLGIKTMKSSSGALREGVLYDLVGRIRHEDARDITVERLVDRYHVDRNQAARVHRTALGLLAALHEDWKLHGPMPPKLLGWAARLCNIGLAVSYTGHHKHSAYLVTHGDMPGFSDNDRRALAAIVRGHRRKLGWSIVEHLPAGQHEHVMRLIVLLRLAVLLNRARVTESAPSVSFKESKRELELRFAAGWLDDHPLTVADLEGEASYLKAIGVKLVVSEDCGLKTAGQANQHRTKSKA